MSSSRSRNENITPLECNELFSRYLTRTTNNIRNPIPGGRSIDPTRGTFLTLFDRCGQNPNIDRNLFRRAHEEFRFISSQGRIGVPHSPFALSQAAIFATPAAPPASPAPAAAPAAAPASPPAPAPAAPAAPASPAPLGPAPAARALIRPWFPYIPVRGPDNINNSIIYLQRALIAFFVIYEKLYEIHDHPVFTPQRLLNGLVEVINRFVVIIFGYSAPFDERQNILLLMHPVIMQFLMDINELFAIIQADTSIERNVNTRLTFDNVRSDLNRFIRYCHNIFILPNTINTRNPITHQFRIVNDQALSFDVSGWSRILYPIINGSYANLFTRRFTDIYRQGPPLGRYYAQEDVLTATLFIVNRGVYQFPLIPYVGIVANVPFQEVSYIPDTPVTTIPTLAGLQVPPPRFHQKFVRIRIMLLDE
jgi:hypothetical protein